MADYRITPTEELMLIGLYQSDHWAHVYNKRHRQTAGSLSSKDLIEFRPSGTKVDSILCWLTPKGARKVKMLDGS